MFRAGLPFPCSSLASTSLAYGVTSLYVFSGVGLDSRLYHFLAVFVALVWRRQIDEPAARAGDLGAARQEVSPRVPLEPQSTQPVRRGRDHSQGSTWSVTCPSCLTSLLESCLATREVTPSSNTVVFFPCPFTVGISVVFCSTVIVKPSCFYLYVCIYRSDARRGPKLLCGPSMQLPVPCRAWHHSKYDSQRRKSMCRYKV